MVQNLLEVEKQTNKRKVFSDGTETAPLQRHKREGNKIGVLPYRFNKLGGSR